jgi:hypothetical protein
VNSALISSFHALNRNSRSDTCHCRIRRLGNSKFSIILHYSINEGTDHPQGLSIVAQRPPAMTFLIFFGGMD